jgi:hypothetical protein
MYRKSPQKDIDRDIFYSTELVDALEDFINWKLAPGEIPTASDIARLRKLEHEEERGLDDIDLSNHVLCSGFAGTGKTVLGLQFALRLQSPTLFTCYNKVLATDIRRLTGFGDRYRAFPFDVYDVFDLMDTCERRLELPYLSECPDDKGVYDRKALRRVRRIIVHDKQHGNRLAKSWRIILVDEAQDLRDYAWELLDWLSADSLMFVIDGKRQQLYRPDRAEYLDKTLPAVVPPQNKKISDGCFELLMKHSCSGSFLWTRILAFTGLSSCGRVRTGNNTLQLRHTDPHRRNLNLNWHVKVQHRDCAMSQESVRARSTDPRWSKSSPLCYGMRLDDLK